MRIAMISWEAQYAIAVGGVAVHVSHLADALRKAGHQVHIFTRLGSGQRLYDNVFGVHYHRCPCAGHESFVDETEAMCQSFLYYLRRVEDDDGPFDVIHCHDWLTLRAGMTLREERSARLVVTYHTTELGRAGEWPERGEALRISEIERAGIASADRLIAVSTDVRRQLDQLYECPDWKKEVIYHGVDTGPFDQEPFDRDAVKKAAGVGPETPLVLFAGRLHPQRGADLLLDAMPHVLGVVPEAVAIFVGEGDLAGHLQAASQDRGFGHAVRLLGWRQGRELADLYRACDCVSSPARVDPFGMVVLSAWAASRPVVATRTGAPAEFIKSEDNGLLVDSDPAAVADGLVRLLSAPEEATWMGRNGRVAVETAFTWDVVAGKTLAAYRRDR